ASAAPVMAVSEGLETGLSVQLSTGLPTWAALSAGGILNLILPPLPLASEVVIAADADPVGMKSAQDAALLWREQGRCVRIALPPTGLDFNDVLRGAAR
ncbi:MAG: toprim domain-containing protein, partial [Alphaproteobacteria bacterium]|nr:toprim domain-containing protein [Alphaproteobacteria bacterium]